MCFPLFLKVHSESVADGDSWVRVEILTVFSPTLCAHAFPKGRLTQSAVLADFAEVPWTMVHGCCNSLSQCFQQMSVQPDFVAPLNPGSYRMVVFDPYKNDYVDSRVR